MDAESLLKIFTASFHQDPNVRIRAELELRKLESTEGLLSALLHLMSPKSPTPASSVIRLAAAIYLKNRISSSWQKPDATSVSSGSQTSHTPYSEIHLSDRQALKDNILPLLSMLISDQESSSVATQMTTVLQKIIESDYPEDWEALDNSILELLNGHESEVETGLRAVVGVVECLRYSFKEDGNTALESFVTRIFPVLLSLGQRILSSTVKTPAALQHQNQSLYLLMKAYKNSISSILTNAQQAHDSIVPWGSLLIAVVQRQLHGSMLSTDIDSQENSASAKAHKWAVFSLNRLFIRFGNPLNLASNMKAKYGNFAATFIAHFAPEILKAYLGVVERIAAGEWIPRKSKYHIVVFLEEVIRPKSTWALLRPHIDTLVRHFIFPNVCMTDEEISLFSDDPAEFSRTHFGDFIEDEYTSPCAASLSFISALVDTRTKVSLMPTLTFINEVVSQYPGQTTPKEKDGALRLLDSLANAAVKNRKIAPMLETFMMAHVAPELKSTLGFLRYRACKVIEKYESVDMTWENKDNLQGTLRLLMELITDPDLPVRIQAAIALPELSRYEDVRASMVPNIGRIMQEMLKLQNEVDLDSLTNTTRSLVSEFSEEVMPFAVELSQSLTESYGRIVKESVDARQREEVNGAGSFDDERTLVCMNILKTIDQLVGSLESTPSLLDQIEVIIAPALEFTIRNKLVELFDEVYEILDSLSFFQKKISPVMWPIFEATYQSFKNDATDYFNEMFSCIDNFICFGHATFSVNDEYRRLLVDMFDTVMSSAALGAEDRCTACKLGESMLLNLRGNIDEAIPTIVERTMAIVVSESEDKDFVVTRSLQLHSLELLVTCVSYNAALTLAILNGHSWTQLFFNSWFKNLPRYTRVHDRKICVAAICSLLELMVLEGSSSPLSQASNKLIEGALQVFEDMPAALEKKVEQEKAFAEEDNESDYEEDLEEDDAKEDDEFEEESDVLDESTEYVEMLAKTEADRIARQENGSDSDSGSAWSEEVLWASALDQFDAYNKFTTTMKDLELSSPTLFHLATGGLDAYQRSALEGIARRSAIGGERAEST